jgi:prepilin-type N-terminal cleavage/methylation domain-containing protein
MRASTTRSAAGFTLVEVLIAIGILSLVIASIYSTWTAILRAAKSGQTAAAAVQRTRIVVRLLEDSLSSAQIFGANVGYYGFMAETETMPHSVSWPGSPGPSRAVAASGTSMCGVSPSQCNQEMMEATTWFCVRPR